MDSVIYRKALILYNAQENELNKYLDAGWEIESTHAYWTYLLIILKMEKKS